MQKFITLFAREVESEMEKMFPEKFGMIFDGWSHHGTHHYVGLFGLYESIDNPGIARVPLVAIARLLNEEDLGAQSHIDFLDAALSVYRKFCENVIFLVDNGHSWRQ